MNNIYNTKEYWDERFGINDWIEKGGTEQTYFFYKLALTTLPQWLKDEILESKYSICDIGCALGNGTSLIKNIFPESKVTGIDFSNAAINYARNNFSNCIFECNDFRNIDAIYDILFCSNVIEHFYDIKQVFNDLISITSKHLIILLPFNEKNLHIEHLYKFELNSFNLEIGDFFLSYANIIDTDSKKDLFWDGYQILLIYSNKGYKSLNCFTLLDHYNDFFITYESNKEKQKYLQLTNSFLESFNNYSDNLKDILNNLISQNEEHTNLRNELEKNYIQIINKNNEINLQKIKIDQLNEENILLNNQIIDSIENISKLKTLEKDLNNRIKYYLDENNKLNEKIKENQSNIDILEMSITNIINQNNSLHEKIIKITIDLDGLISKLSQICTFCLGLMRSGSFKIIHLWFRLKKQFLKGDIIQKKNFVKWLFKRRKIISAKDNVYNPLNNIVKMLINTSDNAKILKNCIEELKNTYISTDGNSIEYIAKKTESEANNDNHAKVDITDKEYNKQDIIILGIIDYDFRYQRPQQLANYFASIGHRVFYINANFTDNDMIIDEVKPNIYVIKIKCNCATAIYETDLIQDYNNNKKSFDIIIAKFFIRDAVLVIDYPTWCNSALFLRDKYGFKIIIDYMDDFTGFENPQVELVEKSCKILLEKSDLVIATSAYLGNIAEAYNKKVIIIRNGTEFDHFYQAFKQEREKGKIIGYYGAIAHWFAIEKIEYLANQLPECTIILIGEITYGIERLTKLSNVQLLGELPYMDLPKHLEYFDVCIIPFDTSTNLIKATNPVKFYEYLSAGKKIVATEIPELEPYKDRYVYLTNNDQKFCEYIKLCINCEDTLCQPTECVEFAKNNSWKSRGEAFLESVNYDYPLISIIILSYNQLAYTKGCIESIINNTAYPRYELIIVDNNSKDGSISYLEKLSCQYNNIKVIFNKINKGFAAGNNDGIKLAKGEYIVLLNNDTVVTRGWLTNMLKRFIYDDKIGMVGPVTNSIGNEAKIPVSYDHIKEMHNFAFQYTQRHMGLNYAPGINVLAMFCVMIRADIIEQVGLLSEEYGIGMFEDDDYANKVKAAGYKLVLAEDVFVHHYLSISFNQIESKERMELFEKNKKIYENKWGKYVTHKYRGEVDESTNI